MGRILEGDAKLDKIIEFKCVPERLVYNSTDFKIYGVSVNSFEYPNVQISKYNTATIKGNIFIKYYHYFDKKSLSWASSFFSNSSSQFL